ncbi:MAG: serine/threonine-protein kinase, partial [Polyangiales bacterium]
MMKDRYEVGDLLGRGGMGQVHLARHRAGPLVAIKQVRDTLSFDPLVCDRLANEAGLLRRVRHPNVVRAVDSGHDDNGAPFLVMDRAHGTPLDAVLAKTGALPIERVAVIARQLLGGLAAIHAAGVVHADVKSSNIMIDDEDHIVIIDFGLARAPSRMDLKGLIAGTPSYIAPEVITGESPAFAADIYGAGAVLYELLTGELPFRGPTAVVLTRQLHDVVQAPSERAPLREITAEIDAVVLRALARDPGARFASMGELADALDHAFAVAPLAPSIDLLELTATRDFWGGVTTARPAPAAPATDAIIDGALERVRASLESHDRRGAIHIIETTLAELQPHIDAELTPMAWRLETVLA